MVIIEESQMRFGEYPEENVFHIEECDVYKNKLNSIGYKTCEFVLRRDNTLYFVEAKETNPRQIEADTDKERVEKYNQYIDDIVHKMRDSLALFASIMLKRHDNESLNPAMVGQDLAGIDIVCLLVVKNAEREWLGDLKDKLNSAIKKERRTWKINNFYVLNEAQARSKQFIL